MNYFVDSIYVDDLEDNTPMIHVPPNMKDDEFAMIRTELQHRAIDKIDNQKKIFKNNAIFLDID